MSQTVVSAATGRPRLPWVLLAITVVFVVAMVPLSVGEEPLFDTVFYGALALALSTTGAFVASRQPGNPIGWILCAIGVLGGLTEMWEAFDYRALPTGDLGAWLIGWTWVVHLCGYGVIFLLFPTGRLPTRRWRWVLWALGGAVVLGSLGQAFNPENRDNPYTVDSPVLEAAFLLGMAMLLAGMIGAIASLGVRYRRSSGIERLQLRQLLFAGLLFLPVMGLAVPLYYDSVAVQVAVGVGFLALPVAAGLAILRYRLYDIDVVISRTLLVAGLSAFITLSYVTIVVGVGSLLGGGDEPNLGLSLAATALVAVAFQPVRRRLRRLANRLVFGRRSTPYDVLSRFATSVGAAEASPERLLGVAELMADGTGARPARVWLRVGAQLRAAATWPSDGVADQPTERAADDLAGLPDADIAVPVREGDELLGVLTIAKPRGERVTDVDVDLVERLASASAVLLRNLRLDAELAQRLDEIQASSRRLVTAQDDARQRIETELGGGARAHLQTLHDQLSLLTRDLEDGSAPQTAAMLTQLATSTQRALDTLAGLAAGVYPPRLSAEGLVAALSEQADRAAVPVEVRADGMERLPEEVEAAVYFAVLEALQNVAKYGGPGVTAQVRLACDGGRLSFEVRDDGAGFDPESVTLGTGVQGITDRLNAVGGTATIRSAPGRGTTVAGSVTTLAEAPR